MSGLSAKTRDRLLYLISPIGLLLLWELLLLAGFGDRRFIPAPSDIAHALLAAARQRRTRLPHRRDAAARVRGLLHRRRSRRLRSAS